MESEYELASVEEAKVPDPISADWVAVVLDRQSPNIFLSHSGAQKNFVEQLCEDLVRAKQSPFFDKNPHCLPKEVEFAPLIFTAAQECELAVVVVSDDYFTQTKWPMLELAAIVQASGSKILPLFFGLSCKEFKNKKRRERWFQVWDGWSKSENRISVDVWKDVLRNLDGLNGMEFVEASGEVAFRKEIVTTVCDLMQRRSQDEIIVVETRATLDVFEFDLHQSSTGATRFNSSMFACLRTTLFIVFQQVMAFLTILLLFVGYRNYFHDSKGSPSNEVRLSAGGFPYNNTTILVDLCAVWGTSFGGMYWTHPIKYMHLTPNHRNGKYTTTALLMLTQQRLNIFSIGPSQFQVSTNCSDCIWVRMPDFFILKKAQMSSTSTQLLHFDISNRRLSMISSLYSCNCTHMGVHVLALTNSFGWKGPLSGLCEI